MTIVKTCCTSSYILVMGRTQSVMEEVCANVMAKVPGTKQIKPVMLALQADNTAY